MQWKKLQQKKYRQKHDQFLIEGLHLVEEARKSHYTIDRLLFREDMAIPNWADDYEYDVLSNKVFSEVVQTKTPQGIAAIINMHEDFKDQVDKVLLVDAVQDPGNLGTLIRTAVAFGFTNVVLGQGTVDVYNDKVIRATQGALFNVSIQAENLVNTVAKLKSSGYKVLASGLSDKAKDIDTIEKTTKVALVVGNEGSGISTNILDMADEKVIIPIQAGVESLNVAVAGGIMMYYFSK